MLGALIFLSGGLLFLLVGCRSPSAVLTAKPVDYPEMLAELPPGALESQPSLAKEEVSETRAAEPTAALPQSSFQPTSSSALTPKPPALPPTLSQPEPKEKAPSVVSSEIKRHTVKTWGTERECLWNIAKRYYGNPGLWKKIYEANKDIIQNPDVISPGQIIRIP